MAASKSKDMTCNYPSQLQIYSSAHRNKGVHNFQSSGNYMGLLGSESRRIHVRIVGAHILALETQVLVDPSTDMGMRCIFPRQLPIYIQSLRNKQFHNFQNNGIYRALPCSENSHIHERILEAHTV